MTNPKGTRAETAVARWLQANGYPSAERRAKTGSKDQGDIAGLPGVVIEVKNRNSIDLAQFLSELEAEIENARADTGVAIIKRRLHADVGDWYALLPARMWLALLRDADLEPRV